jgi:hypothetical protein
LIKIYFFNKKKEREDGETYPSTVAFAPRFTGHHYIVIPERFQLIYIYFMDIEMEKHDI